MHVLDALSHRRNLLINRMWSISLGDHVIDKVLASIGTTQLSGAISKYVFQMHP